MAAGRSIDPLSAISGCHHADVEVAVRVSSLSKTFDLPHERYTSAKQRVLHPFSFRTHEVLQVLEDVSFEVARGESFGIVGRNGSGKSTLLRCLAGIYVQDSGDVSIQGRVAPFIELGVGFNPELAARENAVQSAVLVGLSRREARARIRDILVFAELERFADQKLKNYSNGMAARLAFAVAAHVDADVLLCDEVLAVGDAPFQEKCLEHFRRMRDEGTTIVLVTHDMEALERSCSRALLLDQGSVVEVGPTRKIIDLYENGVSAPAVRTMRTELPAELGRCASAPRLAAGRALVTSTWNKLARGGSALLEWLHLPSPPRLATITSMLASTDLRLKYLDAVFSYAWALLRPALLFVVLLLIFGGLADFDDGVPHYAGQLVIGVVLWTFFIQATNASLPALTQRADLLRKLPLPRLAVPFSTVLASAFDLFLNLAVTVCFIVAFGTVPRLHWLELIPLVAALGVIATGMSLALSAAYVRYRDLDQLWPVAAQAVFFLTPIFYVVTMVPAPFERIIVLANPLATVITEARHAVIGSDAPTAASVAGGSVYLLIPAALALLIVAAGAVLFRQISPKAAEYL
jgi:ABC-type polysaccharide/polyol phosphate transport system ATPase subunit/ABC-type polysaccharide/polyol phosphate export permease